MVQNTPYAGLWTLGLLAISEAFIYRMSMPRTQSLSLAILVLGLNFLLQKKHWYLLPLSFIYVWFYDGFNALNQIISELKNQRIFNFFDAVRIKIFTIRIG